MQKLKIFCANVIFVNAFFAFTVSTPLLFANDQTKETYAQEEDTEIDKYEQEGDYAKALNLARVSYEKFLFLNLPQATQFSKKIIRLENALLTLGYSRLLFDENDEPRVKLLNLLELIGIEPLNSTKCALLQINEWAQKNLLRKGERWEEQTNKFETLKARITPLLNELGFIQPSCPHFKEYQGAILHGASLPTARHRLNYLVDQWKQGIRFFHLYFLSGECPYEMQQQDPEVKFEKLPKTECEMLQLLWNQSEIPESMRKEVQIHFVNAPMKKSPKSEKLMRPTTNDTVEYWLKMEPPSGRYLAISNAPYTNRQDLVVRTMAPKEYTFETIGFAAPSHIKIAILLDELARYIFQKTQSSGY